MHQCNGMVSGSVSRAGNLPTRSTVCFLYSRRPRSRVSNAAVAPPPRSPEKKKKLQHTTIMPRCRTAIVAYTRFTYYLVELQRYHTICKYVFLLSTAMVPVRLLSPYPFRPPCHHSRRFLLRGVASASLPPHMPSHQKTVRRLDDHATLLILAPFSTAVGRSNLFAPNNNGELSMDASRARNTLRSSARH